MISFAALTVRYGESTALHGISGRVSDGEWLGVIGPNGAGKTTLLNGIAALLPDSGSVTVCDRAAHKLSRREVARLIAYVPQRPLLPPDMTVRDYVLLGRTAHIGYLRTETAADRAVCAAAIERLDLGRMADRMLRAMSGGELQRAVIARARPSRCRSCRSTSRPARSTSGAGRRRRKDRRPTARAVADGAVRDPRSDARWPVRRSVAAAGRRPDCGVRIRARGTPRRGAHRAFRGGRPSAQHCRRRYRGDLTPNAAARSQPGRRWLRLGPTQHDS